MKILSLILLVFLAGCAADPAQLESVAVEESSRLGKPSKSLSAYSAYELKPFILSAQVKSEAGKVQQAAILEQKVKTKLLPLFADWSSSGAPGRSGTLIVQPELIRLKIVSGGARFWAGAFAGESSIDLDLRLTDGTTNEVIAKPRIKRDADALAGAWSIGKSDENLHDYIAHIIHQYMSSNFGSVGPVSDSPVGRNPSSIGAPVNSPSRRAEQAISTQNDTLREKQQVATVRDIANGELSASQIKIVLTAAPLGYLGGRDWIVHEFSADGSVSRERLGQSGSYSDTGTWSVEPAGRLCVKWLRWEGGIRNCYRVIKQGRNVKLLTPSGAVRRTYQSLE